MDESQKTREQILNELAELREDEKRYRFLLENTKEMILILDKKGTVNFVNKEALKTFGYTEKEVIGRSIARFLAKESLKIALTSLAQEFLRRPRATIKVRVRQKSGEMRMLEVLEGSAPIYDEKGRMKEIMVNARDITEEEKATAALKKSEGDYRKIFENLPFLAITLDEKGNLLEANKWGEEFTGLKFKDFKGKNFADFGLLDKKSLLKAYIEFKKNLQGKVTGKTVYTMNLRDGRKKYMELVGIPLIENKKVTKVLTVGIDVTEIKKAEEELRSSEERLKILFESAPDAYYLNDLRGNFIDGNKAAEKLIGYKKEELVGKNFTKLKLLPPDQIPVASSVLALNAIGQSAGPVELFLNRRDGSRIAVEITTHVVKIKGKGMVLGIARDITSRRKASEAIRESEARFRELFDNMKSGVAVYEAKNDGEDFIIKDFNNAAEKIENIKKDDVIGKSVQKAFPGIKDFGIFEVFKSVWKTGKPEHFPASVYKDQRVAGWRENYVYKLPSGEVVAIYDDVTESKQSEEKIKKHLKELEVFYKASVGREERILELKDEIKRLKAALGEK
jgi:PAS domain S-box-containing protein